MVKSQDGLCAICNRVCKVLVKLSIDHDHATGKIRGLLCKSCNSALGLFEDNVDFLRSAIDYLLK